MINFPYRDKTISGNCRNLRCDRVNGRAPFNSAFHYRVITESFWQHCQPSVNDALCTHLDPAILAPVFEQGQGLWTGSLKVNACQHPLVRQHTHQPCIGARRTPTFAI